MRWLLWAAAACLLAGPAQAEATLSGVYDQMLLWVGGGRVAGAYTTSRRGNGSDDAPQFSCAFLLRGRLAAGQADVTTWTPGEDDVIPGRLTVAPGGASLRLQQNQDGCGMAIGDMAHADFTFTRLQESGRDWVGVGMVKDKRAVLHAGPNDDARRVPYLVAYDAVAVLSRRPGWVQVRYYGEKQVTGWLRTSQLQPDTWPKTIRPQ